MSNALTPSEAAALESQFSEWWDAQGFEWGADSIRAAVHAARLAYFAGAERRAPSPVAPDLEALYRNAFYAGAESQGWSDADQAGCDIQTGEVCTKAWEKARAAVPLQGVPGAPAAEPISEMEGQCGFCCEGETVGEDGACPCSCHRKASEERAALGVCVSALKSIRNRIAVWEENDRKALAEGLRVLAAPSPEIHP